MKKKLIALLLAVLIVFTLIPASALAASFSGYLTMVDMPQYSYGFSSSYPAPFAGVYRSQACQFWLGGSPAYCLEFGKSTSAGMGYYAGSGWSGLSAGDQAMVNYVLMFGYTGSTKYGGTSSQEYWATQVLIWQIIYGTVNTGWENSINNVFFGSGSVAWTVYNYIKSNVYGFQTVPSFCSRINNSSTPTYELTYNQATGLYETSLYDSNGVLSSFNFSYGGYTMSRSGNTLNISTASPQENIAVGSGKSLPSVSSGALVFWTPSYSSYQTLATFSAGGDSDPVNAYFRLKLAAGNIEIQKTTEDGDNLAGIRFTISGTNGVTREAVTDANGYAFVAGLPAGIEYTATEDSSSHNVQYVTALPQTVIVTAGQTSHLDFYNRIKKGMIVITKFEPSPDDESLKLPMEGVTFTVTKNGTDEVAATLVTDENGYASSPWLNYGEYTITEQYVDGYTIIPPFDVFIDTGGKVYSYLLENRIYECSLTITKTDAETGEVIPLAGTKFQITDEAGSVLTQHLTYPTPTDIDVFETAEDGSLTLPELLKTGVYYLHEIEAPSGYTVSAEPIRFEITALNYTDSLTVTCANTPVKGQIEIVKTGEMLTGFSETETAYGTVHTPIYEERSLAGAVFNIIADEDIFTPDGTLRVAAETVVVTLTTVSGVNVLSGELYLGRYRVEEVSVPDGYVLDTTPRYVTLEYADQNTAVVFETATVFNGREKASVTWRKDMELGTARTDKPFLNVVYGLYNRAEITDLSGGILPVGSLIELVSPNADGLAAVQSDLPFGSYCIRELATAEGYILDEAEHDFEFAYAGADIPLVAIDLTPETPFWNDIMWGSGKIVKTDLSGTMSLAGAKFQLFAANGTLLGEYETNANGELVTGPLSYGEYYVVETAAPSGFVLDSSQHRFRITADAQVAEVAVTNARPDIPNTGDTTNSSLWLGLLWLSCVTLLSCGSTAIILRHEQKKKNDKNAPWSE